LATVAIQWECLSLAADWCGFAFGNGNRSANVHQNNAVPTLSELSDNNNSYQKMECRCLAC